MKNEKTGEVKRVFLSSVKAPTVARRPEEDDEAYAFESKEYMRRTLIGTGSKTVNVEMEYKKSVPAKSGAVEDRLLEFASVFVNGKNVAIGLLERGLARVADMRNVVECSSYLEELLEAQKVAAEKKVGRHSTAPAPIHSYNDLTRNVKKSK